MSERVTAQLLDQPFGMADIRFQVPVALAAVTAIQNLAPITTAQAIDLGALTVDTTLSYAMTRRELAPAKVAAIVMRLAGECDRVRRIESDLQCARACMGEHQAQMLGRFARSRKLRAAHGLDSVNDHDFATAFHGNRFSFAQSMGSTLYRAYALHGLAFARALARGGFAFTPSRVRSWRWGHGPHIHRQGKTG